MHSEGDTSLYNESLLEKVSAARQVYSALNQATSNNRKEIAGMKILTHNHAFAQVERVFLIHLSTHFDRIIQKYSLSYADQHKMSLNARGIALSRRISTGGVNTRT